jgi:hypothetical protein
MFKRAAFALMCLLMGGLCEAQQPTPRSDAAIRAVEQAQVQAALAGDRAALEKVFAPGFRLINPSGAIASRDELLQLLTSGKPPYRAAIYTTDSVLDYGRVVITTGTESVEFAADGQRQQRRISQVWENNGDRWQLVLRQATLVAAPASPR